MTADPVQQNMMGGPMRPGISMGGIGPGHVQAQTIMSNQMPNGPNTMVRTVHSGKVRGQIWTFLKLKLEVR